MASPAPPQSPAPAPSQASAAQPAQPNDVNAQAASASYTAPLQAATSLTDAGNTPRPRDARTIHMVLASMGVHAYQERVPLQLLDFAYRYTSSILSDAQHLQSEGYLEGAAKPTGKKGASGNALEEISLNAIRAATASRVGYAFSTQLPKENLLEVAMERNRIRLPDVGGLDDVGARGFGVRLPHERFILSGTDWSVLEKWDSADEEDDKEDANGEIGHVAGAAGDTAMQDSGEGGQEGEEGGEDEDQDKEDYDALFGGDDANQDEDMNEDG